MSLLVLSSRPFITSPLRLLACRSLTSQMRWYATSNRSKDTSSRSLAEASHSSQISADVKPIGERVKENTKTASYMGVIVLGVGVTGIMFYAIFNELFSSSSPNTVYSSALDYCANDPRVQDSLGAPIKGFGEETKRRRRTHVQHTIFIRDGVDHMRMVFYIQGIRNKATVNLEVRKGSSGKYEYRYMFVQLDHYPRTTIILEDNRINDRVPSSTDLTDLESLKLN